MAISIDTVYQRVLALANKEQRGYVTPQEFNLLANQAQMEIFEQYFYDQKQEDKNLKNSTEYSNIDEILDEKISIFKRNQTIIVNSFGIGNLPNNLYRLGALYYTSSLVEVEQATEEQIMYLQQSPLARPTLITPAFVRIREDRIQVYPETGTGISCSYVKQPEEVAWGYTVVNRQALYNAGTSIDFELHSSDSAELVYKIVSLAGIVINKPGLGTYTDGQITGQKTQEKQQ